MEIFEHHQAADSFPMMDEGRFAELMEDIRVNGQLEPIVLSGGLILDGRNRYKACIDLGLQPKTKVFDGDPWAYAWSANGQRRDLNAEQRYLIWKYCNEQGAAWQAEKARIKAEADAKRSEAMQGLPYAPKGEERKVEKVVEQNVPPLSIEKFHKERTTKAETSHTNKGAVQRGDQLANNRPDLAEKVRKGEMKPADAHRTMKREETKAQLEEVAAREIERPTGLFDVIVIDPPWPMEKIERDERQNQVAFDYPTMSEAELERLVVPADDNCHVWLWTTHKFMPMALRLLDVWKFKYVCTFVWHKPGGFQPIGLPQYNCEFALYARKGNPSFLDTKAFPVCFNAPRGKHSEKPEEFYGVVRRVTGGRRLDMFSRREIEGFAGWGLEAAT